MYISQFRRDILSQGASPYESVDLAYVMLLAATQARSSPKRALYSLLMSVACGYLEVQGKSYKHIIDVIGALEIASMAYVRRTNDTSFEHAFTTARIDFYYANAVDLERELIAENGDVTLLEGRPT